MKFKMHVKLILIPLIPLGLMAQGEPNEEGFKNSTVSDYLSAKYKWEKPQAETKEAEAQNDTPLKPAEQKEAESQASIEALIRERNREGRRRAGSDITEEEEGLDTVELKEHRVSELYSPLMRMSEIKNLEVIDPASGGRYLSESYYTDFENNVLNRWTIPLIGRSQEERAKEEYRHKQFQAFLDDAGKTLEHLDNLDPEYAKQVRKEFSETQHQYNVNEKNDHLFESPEAKF